MKNKENTNWHSTIIKLVMIQNLVKIPNYNWNILQNKWKCKNKSRKIQNKRLY